MAADILGFGCIAFRYWWIIKIFIEESEFLSFGKENQLDQLNAKNRAQSQEELNPGSQKWQKRQGPKKEVQEHHACVSPYL